MFLTSFVASLKLFFLNTLLELSNFSPEVHSNKWELNFIPALKF